MIRLFYKYFITYNILVSLLTGLLLKYDLRILGLTPSILISAIFIIFSLLILGLDVLKQKINLTLILAVTYFHIIVFFNVIRWGGGGIIEEINYAWNILLAVLIIFYAVNHLKNKDLKEAIEVNNIIIVSNIIIAWIFDIGYPSYESNNTTIGFKGFLFGGNTASVLAIATFGYYLVQKKDTYVYIMLCLSLVAAILVQTIATVLVPILLLGYIAKNHFSYFLIATAITAVILTPKVNDLVENVDLYRLNRMMKSENNSSIITGFLENSRRIVDSKTQVTYQLNNLDILLIGAGRTGQKTFWQRDDFDFAGMDLTDILFRYGIIGSIIYYLVFIHPVLTFKEKKRRPEYFLPPLLIIFYSLFGGYVSTSITTLVYLSLYICVIRKKDSYKAIKLIK